MLNTRKLVYILPEVCYIAELLPTKKPHTFSIQSFRQINAQFMEDEELVTDNVIKLFNKLDPDTYTLVLPDFLFTSTILDVAETSETGVRQYLLEKLLPSLGLSKETHQLETFILTQHQGKTKVQLSALEKSILAPLYSVAEERGVVIDAISPLSWTLKSVISLEPSLSAVELGKHLYIAQHYIGVEQSIFFSTDELNNVVESVKTLKGAEPNLQTLYLLTSQETGAAIKEKLKQRIPLQQLAEDEESLDGLPAHLKTAIEAAAKTFDIEDYPVPRFALEKYDSKSSKEDEKAEKEDAALPSPKSKVVEEDLGEDVDDGPVPAPTLPSAVTPLSVTTTTIEVETVEPMELDDAEDEDALEESEAVGMMPERMPMKKETEEMMFVDRDPEELDDATERVPLSQATPLSESSDWLEEDVESEELEEDVPTTFIPTAPSTARMAAQQPMSQVRQRPVIKNRNSTGSLVRMIGISIAALIITVIVGVGAGYALLKTSEKNAPLNQGLTPSPKATPSTAQASPTPAATASPSASVAPGTAKDKLKILVVNATGVTGRAGTMKSTLTQAGYKTVDTGNAKAKYEKGYFLLMTKEDPALLSQLEKDSKVKLSVGTTEQKTSEDAKSAYDAVLVINE